MGWEEHNRSVRYAQAEDARWDTFNVTSNGACQGLSIMWIVRSWKYGDFFEWLGPPKLTSGVMKPDKLAVVRAMRKQDQIFKLGPKKVSAPIEKGGIRGLVMKIAAKRIAMVSDGTGTTTLKLEGEVKHATSTNASSIAAETTRIDGYKLLAWDAGPWGHMTAASVSGSDVWFFDPNYGEYAFSDKQSFRTWFVEKLFKLGYSGLKNVKSYEIQHFSWPKTSESKQAPVSLQVDSKQVPISSKIDLKKKRAKKVHLNPEFQHELEAVVQKYKKLEKSK